MYSFNQWCSGHGIMVYLIKYISKLLFVWFVSSMLALKFLPNFNFYWRLSRSSEKINPSGVFFLNLIILIASKLVPAWLIDAAWTQARFMSFLLLSVKDKYLKQVRYIYLRPKNKLMVSGIFWNEKLLSGNGLMSSGNMMAPSHIWTSVDLIIKSVLWYSSENNFTKKCLLIHM